MQNLQQLKDLLNRCDHSELKDPSFGDSEHDWFLNGRTVAYGYTGNESCSITIAETGQKIIDPAMVCELLNCHRTYRLTYN